MSGVMDQSWEAGVWCTPPLLSLQSPTVNHCTRIPLWKCGFEGGQCLRGIGLGDQELQAPAFPHSCSAGQVPSCSEASGVSCRLPE